jgi:hypothetical protein
MSSQEEASPDKNSLELERVCWSCGGRGGSDDCYGRHFPCNACGGSGYIRTALGEKVLALMQHNIRSLVASLH